MLIRPAELTAIRAGEVDLAFRRWERPRVRVGTRMRTGIGLVEVTSVDQVTLSSIPAAEARRAGAPSLVALRESLSARADRPVFRVGLRYAGADPRETLREELPDVEDVGRLCAWLDRLDAAASHGPWTRATLLLIATHPGRRAPDLAAELGRETPAFKRDVRKLKEKGLTESLEIGYRLSPRGTAVLGDAAPPPPPPSGTPLPRVGAPAARALRAAKIQTLEDLTVHTEASLGALHGIGPFALGRLRESLDAAGLDYAPE